MKQLRIIPLVLFLLCSAGLTVDGKSASIGTSGEKPAAIKKAPPTPQPAQKKVRQPAQTKPAVQPTTGKTVPQTRQLQRAERPAAVADLVIRSFSCSPTTINSGAATTLRAVVTNLGSAKALDVEIGFYLDGKKIATRQKLVVEPKQSVPATASFKPEQTGRLNLQARIDSKRALQKVHRKQHRADALLIVSEPRQPMQLKPGLPSLTEVRKPGGTTLPRATEAIADAGTRRPLPADLVVEQPTYHVNLAAVPASGTSTKQPGISFILRNDGPADIDQHQYRRSLVRLLVSNRSIPGFTRMEQIADYATITKPGSQVTVSVPVELPKRVPVAITVNSNGSIFELDKNNNTGLAVLGPSGPNRPADGRPGSIRRKTGTDRLPPSSIDQAAAGGSAVKDHARKPRPPLLPQPTMTGTRPTPETAAPEATLKMLDHGIEIASPTAGDVFIRGRSMPIRYRFSRLVAAGGAVLFSAIRTGVGGEEATLLVRNDNPPGPDDPYREVQLDLPADAPTGLYLLSASHADSAAGGLSDLFRVSTLDAFEVGGDEESIGDAGGFGGPDGTGLHFTPFETLEIAGDDDPIGDAGGFGGSGETAFHFTPLEAVEISKDDDPMGDGGGFAGPGTPALSLITPRAGSHIVESERDGRLRMNLSWRYRGPLASLPEYWLMELVNPATSEIVRSENLTCLEASDTPASETHPLPSRACQASYVDDTLSGSYRLRLSGAGLTAQSAGIIHWGVDVDRPFIGLYTDPRVYIQGDPIPVSFQFRPARSDIVIELFRDGERAYTHIIPRLSCGIIDETDSNGYGFSDWCRHDIPTDDLTPGINNYRLVVRSLTTEVGREKGPFSIQEPPFSETDENSVDFWLAGLRVTEDGMLQVMTSIHQPSSGRSALASSYRLSFMVGKEDGTGGYRRVAQSVAASGGWVDLGHIHGFTTAAERQSRNQMVFTVLVNQPVEIVEPSYDNNRTTGNVRIRSSDIFCRLRAHPGTSYYDANSSTLHYETDQFRQVITDVDIVCTDYGFAPSAGTGSVTVTQVIRSIPGELGSREETISLGRKTINLATAAPVAGETDTKRISLFSSGIDWPRYGDGELRLTLDGTLFFSRRSHRQQSEVFFRYR